ncbi:hypothetical protein DY000_02062413 [Brassica cretica]|uniref:Uncharacterized protein n=1 Tax=Brassica cretica TaxID=69181 RepID=A0ABQ7AYK1_BRACR|nr:hypothetical protein DY000_02062413 [Brassica cretica]
MFDGPSRRYGPRAGKAHDDQRPRNTKSKRFLRSRRRWRGSWNYKTIKEGTTTDPNPTASSQQGIPDVDLAGTEQRNDPHTSSTSPDGVVDPIQTPVTAQTGTMVPDRYRFRVWTRAGDRPPVDSSTTRSQSARPISPTTITQTRKEVAELRGMIRTLVDKDREQEIAHRTITNRLEQAERELAENRASV